MTNGEAIKKSIHGNLHVEDIAVVNGEVRLCMSTDCYQCDLFCGEGRFEDCTEKAEKWLNEEVKA